MNVGGRGHKTTAQSRVDLYPYDLMLVGDETLFCKICNHTLMNKSSVIKNHIEGNTHKKAKE